MIEAVEALHKLLTGKATGEIPTSGDAWLPCIIRELAPLNVIFGFDRADKKVPDAAYPYLLIEAQGVVPARNSDPTESATLLIDVGVRQTGVIGALIGSSDKPGVMDYSTRFCDWLFENQTLRVDGKIHATAATVTDVRYSAQPGSGPWSAKRYAAMTVAIISRKR